MITKVSAMILTEVVPRLQITSADTRLTYAHLLGYCQRVYEDLYYSILEAKPEHYAQVGYIYANANSTSAALSANLTDYDKIMKILAIDFKESSSANYYRGQEISLNDFKDPSASYSWLKPLYNLLGDTIWFEPEPTAALASCGRVYFANRASSVSGGSVTNLPDGWDNLMIDGVCHYGFNHLGNPARATEFLQTYERGKQINLRTLSHRTRTRRRMRATDEFQAGVYFSHN